MHPDRRFHRRLAAETFRLLQQREDVSHLRVLVLLAHRRVAHGSSQPRLLGRFLQEDVTWVDLAALASRPDLDPMLALLTLPLQKEPDLRPCAQRILTLRPDLIELILPIHSERFQGLSPSQIMASPMVFTLPFRSPSSTNPCNEGANATRIGWQHRRNVDQSIVRSFEQCQ